MRYFTDAHRADWGKHFHYLMMILLLPKLTHFGGFLVRPWPCNDEDIGGLFSQVSQSGTVRIINLFVIPCSPKVKTEYLYCRSGYTEDTSQSQIKQTKKKRFSYHIPDHIDCLSGNNLSQSDLSRRVYSFNPPDLQP